MTVAVRLAAFAVAVAAAFGLGFGVGDIAGPFDDAPTHDMTPADASDSGGHDRHEGTEDDQ